MKQIFPMRLYFEHTKILRKYHFLLLTIFVSLTKIRFHFFHFMIITFVSRKQGCMSSKKSMSYFNFYT